MLDSLKRDVPALILHLFLVLAATINIVNRYTKDGGLLDLISLAVMVLAVISYYHIRVSKQNEQFKKSIKKLSSQEEKQRLAIVKSTNLLNKILKEELYELRSLYLDKKLNHSFLENLLQSTCKSLVDILSDTLSEIANEEICVHIKHISPSGNGSNGKKVKTLCNCRRTMNYEERHSIRPHSFADNTHYKLIYKSYEGCVIISDFMDFKNKYEDNEGNGFVLRNNTTWEKYYKSMILVAIRLDMVHDSNLGESVDHNYDFMGMIIADSTVKNAINAQNEKIIKDIVKTFANGIYIYIDRIKHIYKSLEKQNLE